MAYNEESAQILRDRLDGFQGVEEKRMFGGLCFMLQGNMLCGVHKGGAMFRVGKDRHATALRIDGVREMSFTGRTMGGMVETDDALLQEDDLREAVLALALEFVTSLRPK